MAKTAAWTRKEGKDPKGGLNAKGVASYRRENPGSKLQTAVTKKPSELKAGKLASTKSTIDPIVYVLVFWLVFSSSQIFFNAQ